MKLAGATTFEGVSIFNSSGIGLFNAMPVILASAIGAATAASFLEHTPAFNAEGRTS